ncbi:MAG: MFS transporter [Anaerolineaceae bacterium]|nr:MFS transporter [Anaerolineaceae bacterium]
MISRIQTFIRSYPGIFWLVCFGVFASMMGMTMIWPFLTIFLRESLDVSLTTVTGLIAIESIMTLIATLITGPIVDRFGRKWAMISSLSVTAISFGLMIRSSSLLAFAAIMALRGFFIPLYRIGVNAMVADLIPEEKRLDAYSLVRTGSNTGFALGPAIGGLLASTSYQLAFNASAISIGVITILLAIFLKETMPKNIPSAETNLKKQGNYGTILKDRTFMTFIGADTLTKMAMVILFTLLSVYSKENFNVLEREYGLIMMTNAVIGVFFQYAVAQITKRYDPVRMLFLGAVIYSIGLGSVILGRGFWDFIISMVIISVGELIVMPISTNMVARIAPPDMRGRYMGVYGLTMGFAKFFAPMIGGLLNDNIAPVAIWYGGTLMAMMSAAGFLLLKRMEINNLSKANEVVNIK